MVAHAISGPYLIRSKYGGLDIVLPCAGSATVLTVAPQHSSRVASHLELAAAARARCFHL